MSLTRSARHLLGYCWHRKSASNVGIQSHSTLFSSRSEINKFTTFASVKSKRTEAGDIGDSSKVTLVDLQNEKSEMTFSDLKTLASEQKNRDLVRAFVGGTKEKNPTFKILSPGELETAVRKARQYKTKVIYEKVSDEDQSSTRIREKQVMLNVNIGDHDFDIAVKRIQNWLKKHCVVNMTVKKSGAGQTEVDALVEKIKERCKEELVANKDSLNITVK